jgi:hypothetical protein
VTTSLAKRATTLPAYQPASRTDALNHADQYGLDDIYADGADWHQALKNTAARWAAEGPDPRHETTLGHTKETRTA